VKLEPDIIFLRSSNLVPKSGLDFRVGLSFCKSAILAVSVQNATLACSDLPQGEYSTYDLTIPATVRQHIHGYAYEV